MDLVINTQTHENYGAHSWDGIGECPQYWKAKGGDNYIVTDVPRGTDLDAILPKAAAYFGYERDDNYYREYALGHSMEDAGFTTAFEQDQLYWDGKVTYAAKRIPYATLIDLPERDEELEGLLSKAYEKFNSLESKLIPLHTALSTDRNASCSCGSGKKAKKCCNNPANATLFNKLRKDYFVLTKALSEAA